MVRSLTWMSSLGLGLVLSWQGLPAHAQQFPNLIHASDEDSASSSDEATDENGQGDSQSEYEPTPADDGQTADSQDPETEVIKERFPSGKIRIEREVTQDAQGNYVNHGMWKMWNEAGNLTAQGEFQHGKRTGTWVRWYRGATEAKLLTQVPYQQFPGPFISQATFTDGQLDGAWTIYDAKQRKISQFQFKEGRRHGPSTWWFATGRKMREIEYRDGDIDGQAIEYGPEGSILSKSTYQAGRKLAAKTANHTAGSKKSQGMYLFARELEQTPDDWWECKLQVTTRQGKDEKHGAWSSWYANGQRQLEGTYEHDAQVGQFTWWHANGQKSLEGRFDLGKQDGSWTWWYPTGQKSIQGQYAKGNPTGRWTWWKEDGKVAQSADLSHSEGVAIETPAVPDVKPMPQAKKPAKPRPQYQR
jgi:antitoxin component YwqK of YwqJK toxin-antitoxin module